MQSNFSLASLPFHCYEAQGLAVFLTKDGIHLKHMKLKFLNILLFTAPSDYE